MLKRWVRLGVVIGILFPWVCYANQTKNITVRNNQAYTVTMSVYNINRIAVEDDAITHVTCPQSICKVMVDDNDPSGGMYLQVTQNMPFTLYLGTQNGDHLALNVIPSHGLGRIYILHPVGSGKPVKIKKRSLYQEILAQLMRAMLNGQSIEGYGYQVINKSKPINFHYVAWLQLRGLWQGPSFTGYEYEVDNRLKTSLTLANSYFYQPDVAAITITHQTVKPGYKSYVFIIKVNAGANNG